MKKLFMKAFEWLRRKVTAIKTMNGERLTKKEVVVTDSLNAHPSALNSPNETLLVRAERYLWERYEFRYNVLAKCYEVAPSSSPKGEDSGIVFKLFILFSQFIFTVLQFP